MVALGLADSSVVLGLVVMVALGLDDASVDGKWIVLGSISGDGFVVAMGLVC